ncbi:hypothetical protein N9Z14_05550 [Opitutales bacterium]|nr:hypothetical protein [Opitutales bacterium]
MVTRFSAVSDPALPIIAIDLGYSANSRSCGFAHSGTKETQTLRFGECISSTVELLKQQGRHQLILEAVLSTYHRFDGNPDIRGDFEKGRGWYYGPGVATLAAALRFLHVLDQQLPRPCKRFHWLKAFSVTKRPAPNIAMMRDDSSMSLKQPNALMHARVVSR